MPRQVVTSQLGVHLLFLFVSLASGSTYQSHTETYTVTVSYPDPVCSNFPCAYTCVGWGCYRRCSYKSTCSRCCIYTRYRTETRRRCQQHWTGPQCNIPFCTPQCQGGRVCRPGNQCQCITAAGTKCRAEGCPSRSCYPGTCTGGSSCSCPPQFNGTNCENILQTPEISECLVKLFSGNPEVEVASANCAVEGHEPEITWVGRGSFSRIEAGWETKDLYPFVPVPPAETNHIKDARFGVDDTKATVRINGSSSGVIVRDITPVCKVPGSSPQDFVNFFDCKRRSTLWSEFGVTSLPDNSTLEVIVSSRLGGYKILHVGDRRETIKAVESTERKVLFRVDKTRPWHCRQTVGCVEPAITVEPLDAVQNPEVEFVFPNWLDRESGIKSYEVEIYELLRSSSSGETILLRAQNPKEKRTIKGDINKFPYTFPSPGVYSLELTVYDNANNPSKARKIVLYDRENHMRRTEENLFVVSQASEKSGYRWITDMNSLRDTGDSKSRLTLSWKGRYSNMKHVNDGWLSRVQPWSEVDGIDDDDARHGGNRTIHQMPNANGTAFFRLAFAVDQQRGFDLRPRGFDDSIDPNGELPQSTWVGLTPNISTKEIVMPRLTSNDTVVIWFQAFDAVGHFIEERILVRFDVTDPVVDSNTPAILKQNTPDPYTSSIVIKAVDYESGISEVKYYIRDRSLNVNLTSGTFKTTVYTQSACNPATDSKCYCINGGECFLNELEIPIDHCTIDRYYADDKTIEFHYEVMNQARSSFAARNPLVIKFDGNPKCRPVTAFTVGTILAILIGLLILLILVILVVLMLVRWKQDKHPIPDRVRSFATSVRQKVTNTDRVLDSQGRVIYRAKTRRGRLTEDDDDIYVDGSDPGGWRVNRDQVEMAETLAQGKFAIVKKAYLKKGGETKTVAAKFLPTGASESDRALLKSRIAFHGNRVPPHDNIVRLIGVMDDGPVMLLEFCDLTLKDWLSKVEKVDSDVLENMLNFTLHIACGMEHLHSNSIVHRRLAMRNILLKKDGLNGLVAKIIGFGSSNEAGPEEETTEANSNMAVPLKWLAPETLDTVSKGKAVYTEKSDVWAYGVTVWEIYSLGATPYTGKKSAEVGALLKTGYRMPRPNDCPVDLFDSIVTPSWNATPKKRPDFRSICKQIRHFRSGGPEQEGYYAVDPKSKDYDNPKERTSDYTSGKRSKDNEYRVESLYDDTRK